MPQSILHWLNKAIPKINSDNPSLDAELLLCHYLGKNRAYLQAFSEQIILDILLKKLESSLQRLSTGYPLAYVIGRKNFWDMTLNINEHTLIPRSDTETLIEACEKLLPPHFTGNLLDLGTGSGAIAIALSRVFPKSTITATDSSEKALLIAQENAINWQESIIQFMHLNWFSEFDDTSPHIRLLDNHFDVIVSNPPYIEKNDPHLENLSHEPIMALVADEDGLAGIQKIIVDSVKKLKNNGWLLLEHGCNQGFSVRQIFHRASTWQNIQTIRDLGNNERVTLAQKVFS